MSERQNTPEVQRDSGGHWLPGQSANAGGRRKSTREIEAMLDAEHRTVPKMRITYRKLRKAAHAELESGQNQGFTKLYLERVQGPVKDLDVDLSDAPTEALNYLREKLRQ